MEDSRKKRPSLFDNFDAQKYLLRALRWWYLIVLSLFLGLTVAYLGNRYSKEIFKTQAQIISKKWEEQSADPLEGIYKSNLLMQRPDIYQEMALINSEENVAEAIRRLDFDVSYFVEGNILTSEYYPDGPFTVAYDTTSKNIPYGTLIRVIFEGNRFMLSVGGSNYMSDLDGQKFQFGEKITYQGFSFIIVKSNRNGINDDYKYFFQINSPEHLVAQYRSRINSGWAKQGSSLINLSMSGPLPKKDLDFMETFIQVVIENSIESKNQYANNTLDFIDSQLGMITDSLSEFDTDIDRFKLKNIEYIKGSEYVFQALEELNKAKSQIMLSQRYYDYLLKYLEENRDDEIFAPTLIGVDAPLLSDFVNQYINLKLEDRMGLRQDNDENPLAKRANNQLSRLERNIEENVSNLKQLNQDSLQQINREIRFIMRSMDDYQYVSREVNKMERVFNLNDKVYNLLLEKKFEVSIARASTTSDYDLVEGPSINYRPVYPDAKKNYTLGAAAGLGLPLGIILLTMLLNRRIVTKDDVEDLIDIPIIGMIGRGHPSRGLDFFEDPKSPIAESFRGLRSNLNYYLRDKKETSTILITSSVGGEGKTYTSLNLAYYYSLTGKSTLLIGGDLRKPTIHKMLNMDKDRGLSDVLSGKETINNAINQIDDSQLFVLLSGSIPPNPAELLMSEQMSELMQELKSRFEYIIIDSPPFGLVSDTRELLKYVDVPLVLVRQSYTTKDALYSIEEFKTESNLSSLALVFNYVSFRKLNYGYGAYGMGYGYRYGYGYLYGYGENEKKSWWKRVLKR